jgi:hypothetical protein
VKRINLSKAKVRSAYKDEKSHKLNEVMIKQTIQSYPDEEFHSRNEVDYNEKASEWVKEVLKDSIIETIFYFADNGDLQSSAIMLLVFKSKIAFPNNRMSSVLRLYIAILHRMNASVLACEIIKFCNINDIQNEYGKSSIIKTKCQYCRKNDSGLEVK